MSRLVWCVIFAGIMFWSAEIYVRGYYWMTGRERHSWQIGGRWDFTSHRLPGYPDPVLGWITEPGLASGCDHHNNSCLILSDTTRSNGQESPPGVPLLAIGDSFTFGQAVKDNDTWTAELERRLQRPVVNGGVFGYGVDQSYVRMRELLAKRAYAAIIFSLIPEDIDRAAYSRLYGYEKPYYYLSGDGELIFHHPNTKPIGKSSIIPEKIRFFISVSAVLTYITRHYVWADDPWVTQLHNQRISNDPNAIFCKILAHLSELSGRTPVWVLIQTGTELDRSVKTLRPVRGCILNSRLAVIDLIPPLSKIQKDNAALFESFYEGHMTAAGNHWVGEQVAEAILRSEKLRRLSDHAGVSIHLSPGAL